MVNKKYGRLYAWNAAIKACPAGWRLPSIYDWNNIADGDVAGKKLKSKNGWDKNYEGKNGNGTNNFGFSALPGGFRFTEFIEGSFYYGVRTVGTWWSSTEYMEYIGYSYNNTEYSYINTACIQNITTYEHADEYHYDKSGGFSVRCVRDD